MFTTLIHFCLIALGSVTLAAVTNPAAPVGGATNPNAPEDLSPSLRNAMGALEAEKASRTPVQQKLSSQLVYAEKMRRGIPIAEGVPTLNVQLETDATGRVKVDLDAKVSADLLEAIAAQGGQVLYSHEEYAAVRAWFPLPQMEELAARPDVLFIRPAVTATRRVGSVQSEGVVTHKVDVAAAQFKATGKGVKVGVLSDSVDFLASAQAKGDLGVVTVLTNSVGQVQDGIPGSGEGTAMLEIVHDMAPDAELFFASAFNSPASFAQNIRDLRFRMGCDIIVDDVGYADESPFQDDIISQAVNAVTASGALYFSSAGNSGNKDDGTSQTWEGDFRDGGPASFAGINLTGRIHQFPSAAYNRLNSVADEKWVGLFWSDPARQSSNDYDLYVADADGTRIVASSTDYQTGTGQPWEFVPRVSALQRVYVVKKASAQARFLHLEASLGRFRDSTAGCIRGHPAAESAFGVAAVDVARVGGTSSFIAGAKCPVETFSSDGPRRLFYAPDGTPYTPGNVSSTGGVVRQKPDIAAADGVTTSLTDFNPFFGTSAAAPHAAAIAALVKSYNPALNAAQIRAALTSSALDNEVPGFDRSSGFGIVMAEESIRSAPRPALAVLTGFSPSSGSVASTVTLNGSNLEGTRAVKFGNALASFSIQSSSQLTAVVPLGARSDLITVSNALGIAQSPSVFTVLTTPVILSVTPSQGSAGTPITITGDFLDGVTEISFNDVRATSLKQVSTTRVDTTVPVGATTGRIQFKGANGTATSPGNFTVIPTPVILGFTPSSGGVGDTLVVTGVNLNTVTSAQINGTIAPLVVNSPNQITLTVPSGASSGFISLVSSQRTYSSQDRFTVVPRPSVTSLSPSYGPVGATIVIRGSAFTGATSVQFNGTAAVFNVDSDIQITATVPRGATTGPLWIRTVGGWGTSTSNFQVLPPPANDAFNGAVLIAGASGSRTDLDSNRAATKEQAEPRHAGNAGGKSVWYQWTAPSSGVWAFDTAGSAFDTLLAVYTGPSLSALTLVASNDDALPLSTSQVSFYANAGFTYRIAVDGFNYEGASPVSAASGNIRLHWVSTAQAPFISGFSPTNGRPGSTVIISGTNLSSPTRVEFNGSAASLISSSSTRLTVSVPASANSGYITVVTAGGTNQSAQRFIVQRPPDNDLFANATPVGGPVGQVTVNTEDATTETGEPAHANSTGGHSAWYRWVPTQPGVYQIDTFGSSFDTVLAVYSGNSLATLQPVAANNDAGSLTTSCLLVSAAAGAEYRVAIDGDRGARGTAVLNWKPVGNLPVITQFEPLDGGVGSIVKLTGTNLTNITGITLGGVPVTNYSSVSSGRLTFRVPSTATNGIIEVSTSAGTAQSPGAFVVTDAPSNDDFASAYLFLGSNYLISFNNSKASSEVGEPSHANNPGGKSLWYTWIAPSSGYWSIDTDGSKFNTLLAVYTGSSLTNLTRVASNDDFKGQGFSRVGFTSVVNRQYWIAVDGWNGASGPGYLRLESTVSESIDDQVLFSVGQGYDITKPLAGQNGWSGPISGNGIVTNFFPTGQQAFVGWAGNGVEVTRQYSPPIDPNRPVLRFETDLAIYDSTNGQYDYFKFRFYNKKNERLLTVGFYNGDLSIYSVGDGSSPQRNFQKTFANATRYHLVIEMDRVANSWRAYLDGELISADRPLTEFGASLDVGSVGVVWTAKNPATPGNNYMVFDNFTLTSAPSPRPTIVGLSSPSRTMKEGFASSLYVIAGGTPAFSYQWNRDGVPIPGANGTVLTLSNPGGLDAGNYTVTVANSYGSITSSPIAVQVTLTPLTLTMTRTNVLQLLGIPNQTISLESSLDLQSWNWVSDLKTDYAGKAQYPINPGTNSHALYRARKP